MPGKYRHGVRAIERRLTDQDLVEHASEAVFIAPAVHVTTERLLGTHVVRRAHGHAGLGELLAGRRLDRLGYAEVGDQRVAALQEDVLGLDVAVDDLAFVGVVQCFGGLADNPDRILDRELVLPVQPVTKGLALDERHHVIKEVVGDS